MLKKQTVWLLTMLSLMVVLSVYYITSDPAKNIDTAIGNKGQAESDKPATIHPGENDDEANDYTTDDTNINHISNVGRDELFTTIRMEIQNQRSMEKSRYEDIVASSTTTIEEKNEAYNKINTLEQIHSKESILQNRILATSEKYEDVLVRFDKDLIHVHVKAEQLSADEANNIMQMVKDEFGEVTVAVGLD